MKIIGLFVIGYAFLPTLIIRRFSLKRVKGRGNSPSLYLTFDDGPDPTYTPQLLDLLKKHSIPCVFFVVGERAKTYPDLIKRMVQEGHSIGIHHYTHTSNWLLSPWMVKKQLTKTADTIETITGERPIYYRPPWGHFNLFTMQVSAPLKVVMWDLIPGDWKVSHKETLRNNLKASVRDGSIIVLHDCGETPGADRHAPKIMLEALEEFILANQDHPNRFEFKKLDLS